MALTEDTQLQRLAHLYHRAQEVALHHYNKMWEATRLFLWAYTATLSASFALFISKETIGPTLQAFCIPVALLAALIAYLGRRVVIQQRTLFAYEWQLRKKLAGALGWDLTPPEILDMNPLRRNSMAQLTMPAARFLAWREFDGPALERFLALTPSEAGDIASIAQGARNRGVYAAMLTMFNWASRIAIGLAIYYSAVKLYYLVLRPVLPFLKVILLDALQAGDVS